MTTMQLPILKTSSGPIATNETLVRYFHQTERDWARHVGEETQLDIGTAFCNPQFPNVWDANCVLDAALPEGVSPAQAVLMAREHFDSCNTTCKRWIMNPSSPAVQTAPLAEYLLANGHRALSLDILHLAHLPTGKIAEVQGLQIIPSRASYRHARALADEMAREWNEPSLAEALVEHLQDPHFDSVMAMNNGQAIAIAGVLAMGEVGRIEALFVSAGHRRRGIGRTMMSRALEICARSLFKHVILACRPDNAADQHLFAGLGFVKVGEMKQYLLQG